MSGSLNGQELATLKMARSRSDMDRYLPKIAEAMRTQGLESQYELRQRIEAFIKRYPSDGFFEGVCIPTINSVVHGGSDEVYRVKIGDYSPTAYAVAAVLGFSAEELFGEVPLPQASPFHLNSPVEKARVCEMFTQLALLSAGVEERSPEELLLLAETQRDVLDALGEILPSRRDVLEKGFGLVGDDALSFAEIAKERGVSRQRISEICKKGLAELRGMVLSDAWEEEAGLDEQMCEPVPVEERMRQFQELSLGWVEEHLPKRRTRAELEEISQRWIETTGNPVYTDDPSAFFGGQDFE